MMREKRQRLVSRIVGCGVELDCFRACRRSLCRKADLRLDAGDRNERDGALGGVDDAGRTAAPR
jgi:hypothetical protein